MFSTVASAWQRFAAARPTLAQLIVFGTLNVAMTLLQLILMPVFKAAFGQTSLVEQGFQALAIGDYFLFDYPAGALPDGGGGLAYFLAVQITLAIAQIINFFAQRTITFKSDSNPWWAAFWYALAYVVISIGAAALQSVYKAPIYELLITGWSLGATGETLADVITMLINALISCAVYFPIFKLIFRQDAAPRSSENAQVGRDGERVGAAHLA